MGNTRVCRGGRGVGVSGVLCVGGTADRPRESVVVTRERGGFLLKMGGFSIKDTCIFYVSERIWTYFLYLPRIRI